jgi:2-dehydropantoate 2-reductase
VNPNQILIFGTGALATLFAARISSAGIQVTISGTWKAALDSFLQNGAQIEGIPAQHVEVIASHEKHPSFVQSLVLVKSRQTDEITDDLLSCLEEDGLTLTLQNGLGNKEKLISILGKDRVVSGVTTIGARLVAPGIVKISGKEEIWIERHPKVDPLVKILRKSKFHIHLVDDIQPYIWRKLIVNCAINPLTGILRVKNGELLEDPKACELLELIVREVVYVSKAINIRLGINKPEQMVKKVAQETSENLSSMLQDIFRGVPTEIDAMNGEIIRIAEFHNLNVPVNKLVYAVICEGKHLSSSQLMKMIESV